MTRIARLLFAFAAAAPLGAQSSNISRAAFAPRADSLVKAFLAETGAPSATVAVIRGRDTLVYAGYGLADIDAKRAATPTTVYRIGSITKQFTSSAIMRLVEQGKVKLDDDLSKYVPQFPLHGRHVTIRQLLNHTSGIHSYTSSPAWRGTWSSDLTPDSIVGFVARDTFDFAPGTAWRYNNTGYVLLGMVIEKATGQKYASYLENQFFKPLGLRRTSYCPSRPTDPSFAAGYTKGSGGPVPSAFLSLTHPFAAGALCSTVGDLARWQRALVSGKVVSPASFRAMTTPDTLNNGKKLDYGFGLVPGTYLNHQTIGHGGGINGFTTSSMYVPDDSLSVIVFTNYDAGGPDPLAINLLRVAYGVPPVGPPKPGIAKQPPAAERDAIVGAYVIHLPNGNELPLRVFLDNGNLMAQAQGQGANPMNYLGDHVYGMAFDASLRMTFAFDAQGRATKFTLVQGGATMDASRVP